MLFDWFPFSFKQNWSDHFIIIHAQSKGKSPNMLHVLVEHRSSVGEMKRINKFSRRPRENKVRLSLWPLWVWMSVSFYWRWAVERVIFSLPKKKNQNNVLWQSFTNVVTIYKVKLIFPPLRIKIWLLNRLEFEMDRIDLYTDTAAILN